MTHCAELDSRSMILRRTLEKYEHLGKNETKNLNILTHWSVAQAGPLHYALCRHGVGIAIDDADSCVGNVRVVVDNTETKSA